jgi:hypothetical protein
MSTSADGGNHHARVEPVAAEHEFRAQAVAALEARDWYGAYQWAKGWIGGGGGAWIIDPWLVYAASALLHRQPRIAVRSLDLALERWISDQVDRAVLLWARGVVIMRHLSDPKTAMQDLEEAARHAPDWLRLEAATTRDTSLTEAARSRKRKAAVKPAPRYAGPGSVAEKIQGPRVVRRPGTKPPVWDDIRPILTGS